MEPESSDYSTEQDNVDEQRIDVNENPAVDQEDDQPIHRFVLLFDLWRKATWCWVGYLICTCTLLIAVVSLPSGTCPALLRAWSWVQLSFQALSLVLNCWVASKVPRDSMSPGVRHQQIEMIRPAYIIARFLDFWWFCWSVLGCSWLFSSLECSAEAPVFVRLLETVCIAQLFAFAGFAIVLCVGAGQALRVLLSGGNPAPAGASKRLLKKLRVESFRKETSGIKEEDATCGICLSEYEESEKLRFLPCGHHFHQACIDQWLHQTKSCPFCKQVIDKPEEEE